MEPIFKAYPDIENSYREKFIELFNILGGVPVFNLIILSPFSSNDLLKNIEFFSP